MDVVNVYVGSIAGQNFAVYGVSNDVDLFIAMQSNFNNPEPADVMFDSLSSDVAIGKNFKAVDNKTYKDFINHLVSKPMYLYTDDCAGYQHFRQLIKLVTGDDTDDGKKADNLIMFTNDIGFVGFYNGNYYFFGDNGNDKVFKHGTVVKRGKVQTCMYTKDNKFFLGDYVLIDKQV